MAGFGSASQPIADKSAPTPFGQKRVVCADRATLRLSANCRGPTAKPAASMYQIQPKRPGLGPLRSPSRTSPTPCGPKRFMCTDRATLRLSGISRFS
ncbi:hypothetical protein CXB34_00010 [Pseudomonas amygdali pv. morsprunorum]|nr:hypothetical protein CXB34_00010 [Pseudomonas amygdali pv. morsprunorum]